MEREGRLHDILHALHWTMLIDGSGIGAFKLLKSSCCSSLDPSGIHIWLPFED